MGLPSDRVFALQRTDRSRSARGPLFAAKLARWSEHPVLSKPPMIRGIIPTDGSPGRADMSVGNKLRQRGAMGGERERRRVFQRVVVDDRQPCASILLTERYPRK